MTRLRTAIIATVTVLALGGGTAAALTTSYSEDSTSISVSAATVDVSDGTGIWDADTVHEIAVEVDDAAVAAMIDTYQETGRRTGSRPPSPSTVRPSSRSGCGSRATRRCAGSRTARTLPSSRGCCGSTSTSTGRRLDGWTDFVVRSNNSATALNEAVALDLLAEAGLVSEHAIATSFSVNGGEEQLRLVVQALDESWESENFATDGLLYKSEAGGDWT